jgi:hypothetical protein
MYDHNQLEVPDSFVALFVEPGRQSPSASRATVAARYEFCEDLANHLMEPSLVQLHKFGLDEREVLARVLAGLEQPASVVEGAEARWVVRRLAELQGWPALDPVA